MNAEIVKKFFEGCISIAVLAHEVAKASGSGKDGSESPLTDLKEDFVVTIKHLIALCDAVLSGALRASSLETLASTLIFSEHFVWDATTQDGKRITNVLYEWDAPDTNYSLTPETVRKYRYLLLTGKSTFADSDLFVQENQ